MTVKFLPWRPDADVYGEAAGVAFGSRFLDLVVTYCGDQTFEWEVVDACDVIEGGITVSAVEARRAAEFAGRRALFCVVA
ncbi:MAG TPA: hypothetical protein VGN93_03170 [Shinella sp.]|jgi:hypothetical protein|uniref:hypothetical protein n=1 Tax=Shinella sp. TaxID=1870904 RepID=UPI002E1570B6|nr:hypothetical protein [Shinella sp.]